MARNEKRGKRDRREDKHDGKLTGPQSDAEDVAVDHGKADKAEIRRRLDVE